MSAPKLRGFAAYVLPAILYALLIYFISSLSTPPAPTYALEWGDKINHTGAFGLMMLFGFRAFRWLMPNRSIAAHLIAALIFCCFYGASDEYHQSFVPNRTADVMDWIADSTGAILATLFILFIIRTRAGRLLFGRPRRIDPAIR
ncbi:MAG: VanZ family protein [Chlorobi bacterium]|nr:VanZ family protein [Chlorobiota bacterium]